MIHIKNFLKYTKYFGIVTGLGVNLAHFFLNRTRNVSACYWLYEFKHKSIERYLWNKYKTHLTRYTENSEKEVLDHSKMPIWVCWLQGEDHMPPMVGKCYKSIIEHAGSHPVVLITLENLYKYINLAPHILSKYKQGIIGHPLFSDIIRINLLCDYGGIWIDSTYLITGIIPDNLLKNVFFSIKLKNSDNYSASRYRWQISFISTNVVGSELFKNLKCFFEEYTKNENQLIDYLLINYAIDLQLQKISFLADHFNAIPFTNPDLHTLRPLLSSQYDETFLNEMNENTWAYKLTYKESLMPNKKLLEKTSSGIETFYGRFINE